VASYQRIALFILFDSLERDLVNTIRQICGDTVNLTPDEQLKAQKNLRARSDTRLDPEDSYDQLYGLDLGDKLQVLLRHKSLMDDGTKFYYVELADRISGSIPVRNAIMHGRPLTINEYSIGFAFAQSLLSARSRWPELTKTYLQYSKSPETLVAQSVQFLDEEINEGALSNLPTPDYDDTGFLPRPKLERELKQKILGRHPVITVLGDGGNGKTALALQTLYGLVDANDHPFDAILWFSAKTTMLGPKGIEQIEGSVSSALEIVEQAADFQRGDGTPRERLRDLLSQNRILLAIDNVETITGTELQEIAEDVPGQSKMLFTSRVPVGGDLTVNVGEFLDGEAITYLRSLIRAYGVRELRSQSDSALGKLARRLGNKPLLLKWLVLGVKSGLDPAQITADPKIALKFCLENVMTRLSSDAQEVIVILSTLPIPGSTAIIAHIGDISLRMAEDGLSELARFGLLESVSAEGSERLFRLRGFARAYVIRIISPSAERTERIRKNFSRLESDLQTARSTGRYNPYDRRNYTIRSLSEFVTAEKLRQAVRAALSMKFDNADALIAEAKISNPGYFEVYRSEAFIASEANDVFRAIASYETALEFGEDQPQLHYFFGGLLMRADYTDRAAQEFDRALELDPESSSVYREAARNEFFRHDFKRARKLLDAAERFAQKSHRDLVILADLQIQSYVRELEFHVKTENRRPIPGALDRLLKELDALDLTLIDQTAANHIMSVLPALRIIERTEIPGTIPVISAIRAWIDTHLIQQTRSGATPKPGEERLGRMKSHGRQPTYGFVVDKNSGDQFFAHRSTMTGDLWDALCAGEEVVFEVVERNDGKVQASVLRLSN
jgi:tetratricopeptide (TPR) repeat protein/cold shock CspA family protein